ncbi:MAG TPA: pyridoxal-phosphate dependent enzyme [Longimicrobiaceae bacterium]|nr:pyridoxal-phosphate dependent enzyme [Longimicrobiaceae bacterium]
MLAAARRLEGVVRATPLERSAALSARAGTDVFLKLETHQRTGSFKLRGACNAVAALGAAARGRGVVTASAGNHGLGVALAARLAGAPAVVYLPADAPETKRRRIAGLGAEVRPVPGGYDDAHRAAEAHAERTGACFVHAYSEPAVVAGQGTVGLEIVRELPGVRTLVVPVGGGGLVGGIGTVAHALGSGVRVVGVQSEATAAMHASLAAGALRCPPQGPTLCEGLSGEIDARSLALAQRVVDEVVLVPEGAVRRAMRWLYLEEGVVAEGSAAVAAAAVLEGAVGDVAGPAAVVLTGSNVDAARLAAVLSE